MQKNKKTVVSFIKFIWGFIKDRQTVYFILQIIIEKLFDLLQYLFS